MKTINPEEYVSGNEICVHIYSSGNICRNKKLNVNKLCKKHQIVKDNEEKKEKLRIEKEKMEAERMEAVNMKKKEVNKIEEMSLEEKKKLYLERMNRGFNNESDVMSFGKRSSQEPEGFGKSQSQGRPERFKQPEAQSAFETPIFEEPDDDQYSKNDNEDPIFEEPDEDLRDKFKPVPSGLRSNLDPPQRVKLFQPKARVEEDEEEYDQQTVEDGKVKLRIFQKTTRMAYQGMLNSIEGIFPVTKGISEKVENDFIFNSTWDASIEEIIVEEFGIDPSQLKCWHMLVASQFALFYGVVTENKKQIKNIK